FTSFEMFQVAVIIPFRDRQTHLTRLIDFLVPMLKRQLLDFRFIVTEQDLFNKGRIMNAAFRLAERLGVDCVIFHDVDMFPQDDHNSYGCPTSPRHIGAFVSNLGYQLWYKEIVGGVLAISMDDYRAVNGYSNMYWAWGGEDDDMGKRILSRNVTIERPDPSTGRFSMLKHVKRKRTAPKQIYKLFDSADTRWQTDGLNVTAWKVVKFSVRPLYYHIYVDVGTPPPEWRSDS
uniref:Beta-1,4-N-acetylgalactosaminyltransferase n=1 Tax=Parascaris univalens TaxID=6257 RepID=A0A914ZVI3_PARUN